MVRGDRTVAVQAPKTGVLAGLFHFSLKDFKSWTGCKECHIALLLSSRTLRPAQGKLREESLVQPFVWGHGLRAEPPFSTWAIMLPKHTVTARNETKWRDEATF